MKYQNGFQQSQNASKIGVLVTNLGTPEAPTKQALKPYLKEFLSDPRVVEAPRLLWWMVLNLVILNIRPKKSAHAYSTVWTENGSPLMAITKAQASAITEQLQQDFGDQVVVDFAMRYGQPSIENAMLALQAKGADKILVLPLYPQYSASTSGSTFDAIAQLMCQSRFVPSLRFIHEYHQDEYYISALADKIAAHWQQNGQADKLIFSFHGIPQRYADNGDPYQQQCFRTGHLVAAQLGLSEDQYMITFQSRFGREKWLTPYTDETLKSLPQQGVKYVQMVCPGFSADCLETIEEIGEENREYFEESGGERYEYIAALNDDAAHIDALCQIIRRNLQGWV